jgi:hypothetical protein
LPSIIPAFELGLRESFSIDTVLLRAEDWREGYRAPNPAF